ncbi:Kinesin-like protein NACK2 [Capsicum chinense]|nr:Kinesin-like protein NACK2 [Capsicum chinense]
METQMCIQCLQRRIESDFSDQFIFCYGLFDSPLPLGSTVVVQNEDRQFTLKFSAMEIYNEVVRDLLTTDNTPLRLLNDPERGTVVEKFKKVTLKDWNHLKELLSMCEAQRKIGETALNEVSSRSHQIMCQIVESTTKKIVGLQNASTLTAAVASKSTSA